MIQNNSKNVQPGDVFVAIPNLKVEEYIKEALERGASAVVGQEHLKHLTPHFIETNNPRLYLAQGLAKERSYKQPDYCVAVTGTNGKTSVVHFLKQIWDHMGVSAASLGTLGLHVKNQKTESSLTTLDPLLFNKILKELPVNYFAFEASSHGLDQHRVDGVQLKAVAFTNLTQDHLDYHLNMENYFQSKRRLFTELADSSTTKVIFKNCPYGRRLIEEKLPNTIPYGHEKLFNTDDLIIFGKTQILNLTAAILLSGFSLEVVKPILPLMTSPKGRLEYVGVTKYNTKVFVDYAHTPNALQNVLEMARELTLSKLIVVFGCGGNRDKTKRPLMGKIASDLADVVIVTDDNPRYENPDVIRAEIIKGTEHAFEIHSRDEAILQALNIGREGDVIVISGKGHEEYQDIQGYRYEFSDEAVVKSMING